MGTQLQQLLSAVPDALWVRFVDLNIANGPNLNENRGWRVNTKFTLSEFFALKACNSTDDQSNIQIYIININTKYVVVNPK